MTALVPRSSDLPLIWIDPPAVLFDRLLHLSQGLLVDETDVLGQLLPGDAPWLRLDESVGKVEHLPLLRKGELVELFEKLVTDDRRHHGSHILRPLFAIRSLEPPFFFSCLSRYDGGDGSGKRASQRPRVGFRAHDAGVTDPDVGFLGTSRLPFAAGPRAPPEAAVPIATHSSHHGAQTGSGPRSAERSEGSLDPDEHRGTRPLTMGTADVPDGASATFPPAREGPGGAGRKRPHRRRHPHLARTKLAKRLYTSLM